MAKDPARRFQTATELAQLLALAWHTSSSLFPFPCHPALLLYQPDLAGGEGT